MAMQENTSNLVVNNKEWLYLKATPRTTPPKAQSNKNERMQQQSPSQSHLIRPAVRICRALLSKDDRLLALPCDMDTFSGSASFFVFYHRNQDKGPLRSILRSLDCNEVWEPPPSEIEEGAPLSLLQEAFRLAVIFQLNLRGWVRIGDYMVAFDGSVANDNLIGAKLNCWINAANMLCFSASPIVCRLAPLKWNMLSSHPSMCSGELADSPAEDLPAEDAAKLRCHCLPSLNKACVVAVSKTPPPQLTLKTENDYRDYWAEVHGYALPRFIEGYVSVSFGLFRRTYPSCCLTSQDMIILTSQTKARHEEILHKTLETLTGIVLGGQSLSFPAPSSSKEVEVSWKLLSDSGTGFATPTFPRRPISADEFATPLIVPKFPKRRKASCSPISILTAPTTEIPWPKIAQPAAAVMPSPRSTVSSPMFTSFAKPAALARTITPSASPTPVARATTTPTLRATPTIASVQPVPNHRPVPAPVSLNGKRKRVTVDPTREKEVRHNQPSKDPAAKESPAKRVKKQAPAASDLASINFAGLVTTNKLATLSVPILQAYCRVNNVGRIPRKKDELMQLVTEHVRKGSKKNE